MKLITALRWPTLMRVAAALVVVTTGLGWFLVSSSPPARAATPASTSFSPDGNPLLLVHGFSDTCEYAFNRTDQVSNTGLNAITTVQYLTQHGWNSAALDEVGYYDPTVPFTENLGTATTYDNSSFCTHNLQYSDQTAVSKCSTLLGNNTAGTINDPLEHLGCLLAWYIYDTYTQNGRAVDILAHSMGGLIVRDAIAESGHPSLSSYPVPLNSALFPPKPLNVHTVVTVGTPHGGVYGLYYELAQLLLQGTPTELSDMNPVSDFMTRLLEVISPTQPEAPQGASATYWALIASSVPCSTTGTGAVSCAMDGPDPLGGDSLGEFPEGDGVVQADSALQMPANLKILYGDVLERASTNCPGGSGGVYVDSGGGIQSQYSHEANTCSPPAVSLGKINLGVFCLSQPFYLNDGSPGYTKAFVCHVSCTDYSPGTVLSDMLIPDNNSGQPVLYSLAEIVSILATAPNPPVVDVPAGGAFYTVWLNTGGATGALGEPTDSWHTITGGEAQDFQHGSIYWSSATNTNEVHGAIYQEYTGVMGGPTGALGFPISDEQGVAGGRVSYFAGQVCAGGYTVNGKASGSAIFYSGSVVSYANEVQGCIYHEYEVVMGGPGGALGFPIWDEIGVSGGRVSYFAGQLCGSGNPAFGGVTSGSAIFYSSGTGTHEVQGCIYHEYEAVKGGPGGSMGFPTSDEMGIAGGRVSYFKGNQCVTAGPNNSGSAIYYSSASGTHEVQGCIYYEYWHNLSGPAGCLGFPTSDEFTNDSAGDRESNFQHGYIVWIKASGAIYYSCN